MKTCPVCKAQAFDDAEVCYGCLYRFEWSSSSECPYHSSDAVDFFEESDDLFFEDPEPPCQGHLASGEDSLQLPQIVPVRVTATQGVQADECLSLPPSATLVIQLQIQQTVSDHCLS